MSDLGFIERLLDNTNHIYQTSLKQFDWHKKVQGTRVQVTRIKDNAKYKNVFGAIASSTLPDDQEAEKFEYVILISLNDMKKLFQKAVDQIQFYDNEDKLELGDIVGYTRGSQEYKFKVIDIMTFSETNNVLRQYTLGGLTEVNASK